MLFFSEVAFWRFVTNTKCLFIIFFIFLVPYFFKLFTFMKRKKTHYVKPKTIVYKVAYGSLLANNSFDAEVTGYSSDEENALNSKSTTFNEDEFYDKPFSE